MTRAPLSTQGLPGQGAVTLFDRTRAPAGSEAHYLTLYACNTEQADAACALVIERGGDAVSFPVVAPPLGAVGGVRRIVSRLPLVAGAVARWEGPDSAVVLGYVEERVSRRSGRLPEPLRGYGPGDGIVTDHERALHRFEPGELLTLGVDVPAGETLELLFRRSGEADVRVRLQGPLTAYQLYERVPIGAAGTLLGRVTSGGAAIVYGHLERS